MDDTSRLIERIRSGDDGAWRSFVSAHAPLIRATIARFVDGDEARADLFAETLAKLRGGGLASWRGRSTLGTWLWAVTRNICRDWYRSERGTRHVLQAVRDLAPVEARFFRLFYLQRLQMHEVMEALRLEFGTEFSWLDLLDVRDRVEAAARDKGLGRLIERLLVPAVLPPPETRAAAPPELLGDRALLRRAFDDLATAIGALPERDRTILTMRFVNRSSAREICEVLDLGNIKQVYRRIERLQRDLRHALLDRGVPEEIYRGIVDNIVDLAAWENAWRDPGGNIRSVFDREISANTPSHLLGNGPATDERRRDA
ncbi:MAG: sigma-70 family RNA polymerase sigma factor [Candidatus Krumholzibacteriota bacterium]|nr:sigma-70 family RNA polymerase sigma factor [Candidatus Krumholzibacteriota bacterium]